MPGSARHQGRGDKRQSLLPGTSRSSVRRLMRKEIVVDHHDWFCNRSLGATEACGVYLTHSGGQERIPKGQHAYMTLEGCTGAI